jgi:superfamily II DNA/RNA helicase
LRLSTLFLYDTDAGTPGKALDWSLKFKFFDLKKISVFVLDEADVMIATQGHQDQSIRSMLSRALVQDPGRVFFFFSLAVLQSLYPGPSPDYYVNPM